MFKNTNTAFKKGKQASGLPISMCRKPKANYCGHTYKPIHGITHTKIRPKTFAGLVTSMWSKLNFCGHTYKPSHGITPTKIKTKDSSTWLKKLKKSSKFEMLKSQFCRR